MVILFFLLGRVLSLLGVSRVSLGFGLTGPGLLFRTFIVLGLGSPSCKFLAFVLTQLSACLPCLFGLKETLLHEGVNLLVLL